MSIKEIVCESCEASFTIEYEMLGSQYLIKFCPFCNDVLEEGIEIVAGEIAESDPQSEFEDTQNDHVSVLYVKKDDEDTKPKVRFMEEPMELGNID